MTKRYGSTVAVRDLSFTVLPGHVTGFLGVMVALYTVAVQGDRRATIITAVVASAWSGVLGFTSDDPIGARGGSPVLEMIWPLVPLALGEATRSRRELAAYAEAERDREAQRRVEAERARMAREFHDVVAHTMAAVNVQMAAAVAAFDTDPDTAGGRWCRRGHRARRPCRSCGPRSRSCVRPATPPRRRASTMWP